MIGDGSFNFGKRVRLIANGDLGVMVKFAATPWTSRIDWDDGTTTEETPYDYEFTTDEPYPPKPVPPEARPLRYGALKQP